MENAITVGLSRQIVLTRALDVTANNIANQTTSGFKAEQVSFREFLSPIENASGGDNDVALVYDTDSYTDFSAGGLEQTGGALDFAIDGDGFFAIETAAGVRYTRDGHFGINEFGELITRDGALVLDDADGPILIDPEAGPILVTREGELQQNGAPIARLGVFAFDDLNSLRKSGGNLYAATGEPVLRENATIRQGFVETSNVNPIAAMTDMIQIMRAYENAARVIETSSELARNAVRTLTENG